MNEDKRLRELNHEEIACVSGGTIPIVIGSIYLAAQIGWTTGGSINWFNRTVSRMSFGEALYFSMR